MAITKQDCLSLLFDMRSNNKNLAQTDTYISSLIKNQSPTMEIIKYIYDNVGFEAANFYEKLRKSYNNGRSKLYINIVKDDLEGKDILTCLGSLNQQILIYNKNIDDNSFLRQVRFEEIQKAFLNYMKTGDLIPCQQLLHLFKADLKIFEEMKNENIKSQEVI